MPAQKLFQSVGTATSFAPGETIIEAGKASNSAVYIRKGTAKVLTGGSGTKEVAKRGKGQLIGEMTLLLGDVPTNSVVAESAVETYVVTHSAINDMLTADPKLCGRVFKMMAMTLSERIGEASAKMREQVVEKSAKKTAPKKPVTDTSLNVSKYRQLFGLAKEENLMLRATCSMRKEANALKDANVQFGDLYVFEHHLCFDWKVFGFHKQQVRG